MNKEIRTYNNLQDLNNKKITNVLMKVIDESLDATESKIWHAHPVWFIDENPIVGYSKLKAGVRLMFWSGADFNEPDLKLGTSKFKDASILYNDVKEIDEKNLKRWLKKAEKIQWDYKNIVKRKGKLVKLS
jgi:hypothetical protein